MSKRIIIKVPVPKIRKPVAKKPNTVMKSKKDYKRRAKHVRGLEET
jgi:hypothetical protein